MQGTRLTREEGRASPATSNSDDARFRLWKVVVTDRQGDCLARRHVGEDPPAPDVSHHACQEGIGRNRPVWLIKVAYVVALEVKPGLVTVDLYPGLE